MELTEPKIIIQKKFVISKIDTERKIGIKLCGQHFGSLAEMFGQKIIAGWQASFDVFTF
jgi:hypothetical protein